MVVVTVFQTGG
jgi:hypothetical protein